MIPADNQDVIILANELICQAGITCPQLSVASIHHGGNNQIFLIDCKEKKYILKKYFKHPRCTTFCWWCPRIKFRNPILK